MPIVGIPGSQNWIENPRNVKQTLLVLQLDSPNADALVNLLRGVTTYRQKKIRMKLTIRINTPSGMESVVEKVKADF